MQDSQSVLVEAMRAAPYRLQIKLAQSLVTSTGGAENLLALVERGQASPRLLLAASVKDKLLAAKLADAVQRIEKLTQNLRPASEEIDKLIAKRRTSFTPAKASPVEGARIFTQNCAVCHSLDGTGGLVGPQLDGIGNRGLERLVEDVLDPNRNVDRAFHTHILTLMNGDVISGLPRREEGELLVLAESTGEEIPIPRKDIRERRESETSLMPENFGEILSADDFNHLMAYLLSKRSDAPKRP
ncbi:MAG: c-type cytochrome [Verrucomicrobia bacterium]|nr:c-type cytochrome [Verrucomicrobiota bacterium]